MRKKLKDTGGLTFVELLCAVCILVLLVLMMSTCLNMAVNSYRSITAESEAELLVSSLSDALADKLRYCVVTVKADGSYKETSIGAIEEDADGNIDVTAVGITGGKVTVDGKRLLPDGVYGENEAYIETYEVEQATDSGGNVLPLVKYDPDTNCFNVTFTVKAAAAGVSKTAEFTVRCLNPVKKEV